MRSRWLLARPSACVALAAACSCSSAPPDAGQQPGAQPPGDNAVNPFLEDQSNQGKSDTAYLNPDGVEVEVDVEADVETSSSYQLPDAPAMVAQFALTYLRKRGQFYLESLAEDSTSDQRVEWRVDGAWKTAQEAKQISADKLKHFRIRAMNAVLLSSAAQGVKEGSVFKAKVPLKPYSVMADAGETCGEVGGHIGLSQSVYWYLWDPDKEGCKLTPQEMSVTVSRMLPKGKTPYPEYDQLRADGKLTAVILFGQIGDGAITESDPGWRALKQMASWLTAGGYTEVQSPPVGRRFTKRIGEVDFEIDLYSPNDFSGLSDYSHYQNFERAVTEHEIVTYDGHSMLGASDFWGRPKYPSFYQIFLYGGCLGYEYYVKPILGGKGGWDKLDLMSSVVEVSTNANEFAGPALAKIAWALDHGYAASWRDILVAVRQRVGDSTFGVSGARDNCFSPGGSQCGSGPDPTNAKRWEDKTAVPIPDNTPAGVSRKIEVSDAFDAKTLSVELDVTHSWVGDLRITLEHAGVTAVLWDKAGGSGQDIQQMLTLEQFAGKGVAGTWTLTVADTAQQDTGTLNAWAVVATK
jgi:hypothetical protein